METKLRVLILSDGKAGHLNQSIAFAKLKNLEYDIVEIKNSLKALSYLLDFFKIYLNLFNLHIENKNYKAVVSTGSSTYYANRYLAKRFATKSVAIMLPKGFRYSGFDYILANTHDNPPKKNNIVELAINLSISEPKGLIKKNNTKSLAIIIGGNNAQFEMREAQIKSALDSIFQRYPNHLKYVTTSRRTPKQIDLLLQKYDFDYEMIYSKNSSINPIPDFLAVCDELFITIDSTSMLSEARANSDATLHIIELWSEKKNTKHHKLANIVKKMQNRFDYTPYLDRVKL